MHNSDLSDDDIAVHEESTTGYHSTANDDILISVEGSEDEIVHCTDKTAQQQEQDEVQQECVDIPKNLKTGYQALLMATQADRARGFICEIRCRLCPDTKFNKWSEFKRHCHSTEMHPLTIYFCEYCGDYFARSDARKRHREKRPPQCLRVTRKKADAKRRATKREHDAFIARLEEYLTTGEENVGKPFSDIIKDLYPESSKKRTRGSRE